MKSEWKVYSNTVNGEKNYIAGRQLDISQPLHSGNVEYYGNYETDREKVENLINALSIKGAD